MPSELPKVEFIFAWYDFWVGWFWDQKKRWLYVLPIPCVGLVFKFPPKHPEQDPRCDCANPPPHPGAEGAFGVSIACPIHGDGDDADEH